MSKRQMERELGRLMGEVWYELHHAPDRIKKHKRCPALRARLQGQWYMLNVVCGRFKLDMKNVQVAQNDRVKELKKAA